MKYQALIGWAVVSLAVAATQATTFYTVRTSDRMLQRFDSQTLQFTNVATLGVPFDFGDLAWDNQNQTMYMVQGFAGTNLYTVNTATGAATLVGSHGYNNMFGLTYDPTTDRLFGSQSTTGMGFYELNKTTGAATYIGNPGTWLDALMYDPHRDQVVGVYAGPGSLWSVNRTTGQGTELTAGSGFINNCGMAYDPATDKYWTIDWSGVIYTYDPANNYARATILSGLGGHDGFVSTVVPEPTSMILLALAGLLVRRR